MLVQRFQQFRHHGELILRNDHRGRPGQQRQVDIPDRRDVVQGRLVAQHVVFLQVQDFVHRFDVVHQGGMGGNNAFRFSRGAGGEDDIQRLRRDDFVLRRFHIFLALVFQQVFRDQPLAVKLHPVQDAGQGAESDHRRVFDKRHDLPDPLRVQGGVDRDIASARPGHAEIYHRRQGGPLSQHKDPFPLQPPADQMRDHPPGQVIRLPKGDRPGWINISRLIPEGAGRGKNIGRNSIQNRLSLRFKQSEVFSRDGPDRRPLCRTGTFRVSRPPRSARFSVQRDGSNPG